MKAAALARHLPVDDPQSLIDLGAADAPHGEHDLLVRVEAASVNPADTKLRAPASGSHAARTRLRRRRHRRGVGARVSGVAPGDRVYYAGDIS